MVQSGQKAEVRRPGRAAIVCGTLAFLLVVLVSIASGVGAGLATLGLLALGAGLVAAIRGQARWAFILTRRLGLAVAGAGIVAVFVGAAVSPAPPAKVAADSSPQASATEKTTAAAPRTTVPRHLVAVAPSHSSTALSTSQPPPLPPQPVMAMTCPPGGSVASPVFGEQVTAAAPYTVVIDYGDGDRYTNDNEHLSAIFSHTYKAAGNFTVSAVLTDAAGQSATSSCTYSWSRPVVATPGSSQSTPNGTSGSDGSSGGGDYYTNVDGNQVHAPVQAPSAPAGATAQCRDGSWSFSQHHRGTCSGHGGVARWLG